MHPFLINQKMNTAILINHLTKIMKQILFVTGLLFFTSISQSQTVSPFQTGHNSSCFINVRDMAKMAPGLFIIDYNYFANANEYVDMNGDKHSDFQLQAINSSLTLDLGTFAIVPAFFWGSTFDILGGATYVAGVVPNYMWANVNARLNHQSGEIDSAFTVQEAAKLSGIGDLFITPFGLSYGWTHADFTINYGFTAPTGRYVNGADDNIGLGFWTNQFQAYGYYYPKEDQATAFMLGLTYEINGKIKDEDFKPGNRLTLEYGISQYLSDRFELSAMGGNNWQISDDKGEDVGPNATTHDRLSTLAFSAAYWAVKGRLYVSAKYMFDYAGKQRFLTQGGMISLIFVTNAMDGVKSIKKSTN